MSQWKWFRRHRNKQNVCNSQLHPQVLLDDENAKGINSLNSEQRKVFNVAHTWAKDYVKYDEHDVEPMQIFLSGIGGTSTSYLVKLIYNTVSKTLLYHFKYHEKLIFLLLGPTGISAVNISRTTRNKTRNKVTWFKWQI